MRSTSTRSLAPKATFWHVGDEWDEGRQLDAGGRLYEVGEVAERDGAVAARGEAGRDLGLEERMDVGGGRFGGREGAPERAEHVEDPDRRCGALLLAEVGVAHAELEEALDRRRRRALAQQDDAVENRAEPRDLADVPGSPSRRHLPRGASCCAGPRDDLSSLSWRRRRTLTLPVPSLSTRLKTFRQSSAVWSE